MAKEKRFKSIFVTGLKASDKITDAFIWKELKKLVKELWPVDTGYIITGTSRSIDKQVTTICKTLKLRSLMVPANFQMLTGASAEQLRNADILETFAPERVVIFSPKSKADTLEADTVLDHLVKIAFKHHITVDFPRKKS